MIINIFMLIKLIRILLSGRTRIDRQVETIALTVGTYFVFTEIEIIQFNNRVDEKTKPLYIKPLYY